MSRLLHSAPFLFAVGASLACALLAIGPVAEDPRHALLCNFIHPDCLSNHWLMVWVAERFTSGQSILHNDAYYWPVGDAPWLAGNGSEGFAYAPFHLVFGWPLGANVYLVTILTLNGLAAYALGRAAGATAWAAAAVAPAGTLLIYAIQELGAGRFSQVSLCWLAFFLAAWGAFLTRGGWARAALAAVLLALTALFYWYYAFFGVMAGALWWGVRVSLGRRGEDAPPPPAPQLAAFAALFLALVGPLLYVFLAHWQGIPGTGEDVFPHPEAVQDSTWPGVPFLAVGGRHSGRALPFTVCALAVLGVWGRERRGRGLALLVVGLAFVALMAGPLIPGGPYERIYGLAGPLRRFWWPYRHVVVVNLCVIALAARGVDLLRGGRWWVAVPLALSVPVQLEVQHAAWRAQFTQADVPVTFYEDVGKLDGDVLLEPPLAPEIAAAQTPLIYQLYHRKKLLAGHAMWVERVRPPEWEAIVEANSFLAEIRRLERAELDGTFRFEAADLQALIDQGVGVLVINKEYFPLAMEGLVDAWFEVAETLFGPPVLRAKRVRAFDLHRWNGATEVAFPPWQWPIGIRPGGPTLAIQTFRSASLAFRVPGPQAPPQPSR